METINHTVLLQQHFAVTWASINLLFSAPSASLREVNFLDARTSA
jgi:hypothetical protein